MACKAWRSIAAELSLPLDVVVRHATRDLGLPEATAASAVDRLPLTPHQERVIRELRAERHAWTIIAGVMGIRPWLLRAHARRLDLDETNVKHDRRVREEPEPPPSLIERPPLPSGHELTWGALTADTILAGLAYPHDQVAR